jgi:hypothetical protein
MVPAKIQTGTIIWAKVTDPVAHAELEPHAAIVLNPQHEIDAGNDLDVYVCTISFRDRSCAQPLVQTVAKLACRERARAASQARRTAEALIASPPAPTGACLRRVND